MQRSISNHEAAFHPNRHVGAATLITVYKAIHRLAPSENWSHSFLHITLDFDR